MFLAHLQPQTQAFSTPRNNEEMNLGHDWPRRCRASPGEISQTAAGGERNENGDNSEEIMSTASACACACTLACVPVCETGVVSENKLNA